jgi:hypothetical protein
MKTFEKFMFAEQILNNHSLYQGAEWENYFKIDIPDEYMPERRYNFPLSYFLVPFEKGRILFKEGEKSFFEENLFVNEHGIKYYPFFIHPTTEDFFKRWLNTEYRFISAKESSYEASPTSSYRSLMVVNRVTGKRFIVKVSILANVANGSRHIDWNSAEGQYHSSQFTADAVRNRNDFFLFEDIGAFGITGQRSAMLSEKYEVAFGPRKIDTFGMVIRKLPDLLIDGTDTTICSVASFTSTTDKNNCSLSAAFKKSGRNFFDFLDFYVYNPLARILLELFSKDGIVLEPHCQNVMIELDPDGLPDGKFYYRDFDMTTLDRARFPFIHPEEWILYAENRPDRLSLNSNLTMRENIGTGFFVHFINNLLVPCIKSGIQQNIISEAEGSVYIKKKREELKEKLGHFIPALNSDFRKNETDWNMNAGYFRDISKQEIPVSIKEKKELFNVSSYIKILLSPDVTHKLTYYGLQDYILGCADGKIKEILMKKTVPDQY